MAFTEEDTAEKKSFGYELIDLRMGGVITRLDSTWQRAASGADFTDTI